MLTNHYNEHKKYMSIFVNGNWINTIKREASIPYLLTVSTRFLEEASPQNCSTKRLWFPQLRLALPIPTENLLQILDVEWLPRQFTAERGAGALLLQSDTSISPGSPYICPTMEIHPSTIQRFNPPMNIINCSMERRKEKLRWGRTYRQTNTTDKLLQM